MKSIGYIAEYLWLKQLVKTKALKPHEGLAIDMRLTQLTNMFAKFL